MHPPVPEPGQDLTTIDLHNRAEAVRNQAKLQRMFYFCLAMMSYEEDIDAKKLTYEERIKDTQSNFWMLNEALELKYRPKKQPLKEKNEEEN